MFSCLLVLVLPTSDQCSKKHKIPKQKNNIAANASDSTSVWNESVCINHENDSDKNDEQNVDDNNSVSVVQNDNNVLMMFVPNTQR